MKMMRVLRMAQRAEVEIAVASEAEQVRTVLRSKCPKELH